MREDKMPRFYAHLLELSIPVVVVAVLAIDWILTDKRSLALLNRWAKEQGIRLVEYENRRLLIGPFFWNAMGGHAVFRVLVEYPNGATRSGWVRCNIRTMFRFSDPVEARWDDEKTKPPGFPVIIPADKNQRR